MSTSLSVADIQLQGTGTLKSRRTAGKLMPTSYASSTASVSSGLIIEGSSPVTIVTVMQRSQALRRLCNRRLELAEAHQRQRHHSSSLASTSSCSSISSEQSIDSGWEEDQRYRLQSAFSLGCLSSPADCDATPRHLDSWRTPTAWSSEEGESVPINRHSRGSLSKAELSDGHRDDKQAHLLRSIDWIHGQLERLRQQDLHLMDELIRALQSAHRLRQDAEMYFTERAAVQEDDDHDETEEESDCYEHTDSSVHVING